MKSLDELKLMSTVLTSLCEPDALAIVNYIAVQDDTNKLTRMQIMDGIQWIFPNGLGYGAIHWAARKLINSGILIEKVELSGSYVMLNPDMPAEAKAIIELLTKGGD